MTLLKPLMVPLLPMIEPTLDLDLTAATLDQRVTFTRASTKTYFDSAGFMRTAAANEWPVEYDPSTVTRVNYLRGSRSLEGYLPTNTALTKGYSVAPDGRADGILVSSANTGGTGVVSFALVLTPPTDTPLWCWAMLRAGTVRYIRIRPLNLNSAPFVEIDLLTGAAVGSSSPPHFIEPMGDGIYKFGVLYDGGNDNNGAFAIQALSAPNSLFYGTLDGTQNFEFFGAQAEPGAGPTELIETGVNPAGNGVCLGRSVWEARTNLLPYSATMNSGIWANTNITLTPNAASAPDGTTNMSLLTVTTGGGRLRTTGTTVTVGQKYALTFRLKKDTADFAWINFGTGNGLGGDAGRAWFNLANGTVGTAGVTGTGWTLDAATIRALPNGVYECTIVVTPAATTAYVSVSASLADGIGSGTGASVYVWGAQLEQAAFASPYIPTTTAAVTRSADDVNINDLPGVGYSAVAGTAVIEATQEYIDDDSNLPLFEFYESGVAYWRAQISLVGARTGQPDVLHRGAAGQQQARGGNDDYSPPKATVRFATAFDNTDLVLVASGAVKGTTTSAVPPPNPTKLQIGKTGSANYSRGLVVSRFRYWPLRLSDAELQGLTG